MSQPALIRSPHALAAVCRGFDQMARILALTLGPTQGHVLVGGRSGSPEALEDSGTIARRIVELPGRGEDAGAMIARNLAWSVRERHGDGAATAAVLAGAMVRDAARHVAAGANPMALRRGIERGVAAAAAALTAQARPVEGQELLVRFATGVTGDPELGAILGEMFDLLGADAALLVEEFAAPHLDREYLDGGRWWARPAARGLLPEDQPALVLHDALVVVAKQELKALRQVRPMLELAVAAPGKPPLLLVAPAVSGEALNAIMLNHARGAVSVGVAILTAGGSVGIDDDLSDIALIVGAELLADELGRPAHLTRPGSFGRAGRVTLTRERLTLASGGGDRPAREQRISELRGRVRRLPAADPEWQRLRLRIARLAGGVGIVKIGAHTQRERDAKKELAHKALKALHAALAEGVAPGGGAAYLACLPAVAEAGAGCLDPDQAAGLAVVAAALPAVYLQIVRNHGCIHPPLALDAVRALGPGYGFDAASGRYTNMLEAGVLDSVSVLRGTLHSAASAAIMAITTDLIVLGSDERRRLAVRP